MNIRTVGVVGAGVMGSGIAQVAAMSGFQVLLSDTSDALVRKGLEGVHTILDAQVAKGKLTAEAASKAKANLRGITGLEGLAPVDAVIELVTERLDAKQQVFGQLDEILRPDALMTTNTSGLSITSIAASTTRPSRVVGMHFFNPPAVMRLVEVVRGVETSPETLERTHALAKAFGKDTIECTEHPLSSSTAFWCL